MKQWLLLLVYLLLATGCELTNSVLEATAVPPSSTAPLAQATETALPTVYPASTTTSPSATIPTPEPYPASATHTSPTQIYLTPFLSPTPARLATPPQPPPPGLIYENGDGLWQVTADGQRRQLWARENRSVPPLSVSPDGQRAFYWDKDVITFIELATGTENRLALGNYFDQWCCPVWGSNEVILLGTLPPGRDWEQSFGYLTFFPLDGREPVTFDSEQPFFTTPALSPDGRIVAYDNGRLAHLNGRVETLDPTAFTGFPNAKSVMLGSPAWSPDGAKLAWYIGGDIGKNHDFAVAVAVLDLAEKTAVILHPYKNLGQDSWFPPPVWSPDGKWLAFRASAEDLVQNGIWIAAADGSEEHFMGGPSGGSPVWSPDGQYVIYPIWESAEQRDLLLMGEVNTWTAVPLDLPPDTIVKYWNRLEK